MRDDFKFRSLVSRRRSRSINESMDEIAATISHCSSRVEAGLARSGEGVDEQSALAAVGDGELVGVGGGEELVTLEAFEDLTLRGHGARFYFQASAAGIPASPNEPLMTAGPVLLKDDLVLDDRMACAYQGRVGP